MKLRNKLGFTMVEVIVVVAIIAVMAGLLVPLSMGDTRVSEARSRSRNFYYALQGVMTDYSLDRPYDKPTVSPTGLTPATYYVMLQVSSTTEPDTANSTHTNIEAWEVRTDKLFGTASANQKLRYNRGTAISAPDDIFHERISAVINSVMIDRDGFYYAEVDNSYRVVRSYWSQVDLATLGGAGTLFTKDFYVDSYVVGVFPFDLGQMGKAVL